MLPGESFGERGSGAAAAVEVTAQAGESPRRLGVAGAANDGGAAGRDPTRRGGRMAPMRLGRRRAELWDGGSVATDLELRGGIEGGTLTESPGCCGLTSSNNAWFAGAKAAAVAGGPPDGGCRVGSTLAEDGERTTGCARGSGRGDAEATRGWTKQFATSWGAATRVWLRRGGERPEAEGTRMSMPREEVWCYKGRCGRGTQ